MPPKSLELRGLKFLLEMLKRFRIDGDVVYFPVYQWVCPTRIVNSGDSQWYRVGIGFT